VTKRTILAGEELQSVNTSHCATLDTDDAFVGIERELVLYATVAAFAASGYLLAARKPENALFGKGGGKHGILIGVQ